MESISEKDLELILNDVVETYGYDLSGYSRASLSRRLNRLFLLDKFSSIDSFRQRIRTDLDYMSRFIEEVTVNVTEMFRDPDFYLALRKKVLPLLAQRPFIKVWHAGCATGEEVYSMAILLHEAGLLDRSLIYATDINAEVVRRAASGIFPLTQMREYSANYIASGGQGDFSAYYTAQYESAIFDQFLRAKLICATHNLVSDGSFNEFQIILCRNVLIYFDRELQDRVLNLFDASLERSGYLCLGAKETIRFSTIHSLYKQLERERIWQKEQ